MKTKISFVIIAYNEEKNIANCINSILGQEELKDYEIIVVSDGSKDKTTEIVNNLSKINKNINLIDLKENKGRGNARYLGVKKAKGDHIAFVDADIILPKYWLKTCLKNINEGFDAVGGIAVPDGDVTYIYKKFNLKPKIIAHSTEITGNNGIYKRKILNEITFNNKLRDSEDFDVNMRLKNKGFKLKSIKDLIVNHNESKSYLKSLKWLYQSGKGATRLLKKHKKIRLPDLAFFGFIVICSFSITAYLLFRNLSFLSIILLYPFLTSFLHLYTRFKFNLNKSLNILLAGLFNYPFMFLYYIGRIVGFLR